MPQGPVYLGTGRRKTAVARVRLTRGSGNVLVNGKNLNDFFPNDRARQHAISPLRDTDMRATYDVTARCNGGGTTGQAGAVRLGIARALIKADNTLEQRLRDDGHLTRDPREVERKKYGRRGARAGFQFSKR
jgi:small subunit ribosomal protein S9